MSGSPVNPDSTDRGGWSKTGMIILALLALPLNYQYGLAASTAGAPTLQTLFSRLASRNETQVRFVETKTLGVLSQPIRLEGVLEFHAPSYLAKHVEQPAEEHYVIEGQHVTVSKPAEPSSVQLNLSDYPPLAAFAEGLRAPLAGDLAALRRYWTPSLGGSWKHWRLVLTPIRPELAALVRQVQLEGQEDRLTRMTLEETGGDRSTLDFVRGP